MDIGTKTVDNVDLRCQHYQHKKFLFINRSFLCKLKTGVFVDKAGVFVDKAGVFVDKKLHMIIIIYYDNNILYLFIIINYIIIIYSIYLYIYFEFFHKEFKRLLKKGHL